jgi:hypothetical protein
VFTLYNKRNLPAMRAHPSISDNRSCQLLSAIVEHARSGLLSFTVSETEDVPHVTIPMAAGTHRFGVFAVNTAGTKWEAVANATVK